MNKNNKDSLIFAEGECIQEVPVNPKLGKEGSVQLESNDDLSNSPQEVSSTSQGVLKFLDKKMLG